MRPILRYRPRVFHRWILRTMIPCTARRLRGPKLQGLDRRRNGSGQSRWHQRTGVSVHGPGSETTCWIPSRKKRSDVRGYSSRLRWRCAVRWSLEPGYRLRDSAGAQRGRQAFAYLEKEIFLRRVLAIRYRSLRRPVRPRPSASRQLGRGSRNARCGPTGRFQAPSLRARSLRWIV